MGEETSKDLGLICIQEYIVDQLRGYLVELVNAYDNNTNKEVTFNTYERLKTKIRGRINYFASPGFIKQLKGEIPSNTQINNKDGYTKFLQNIFDINLKEIAKGKHENMRKLIEHMEAGGSGGQCAIALSSKNPQQIHINGNLECYLCGRKMVEGDDPKESMMECEHILSVLNAISYWWLIQSKRIHLNPEETPYSIQDNATLEYAWSHRCCNQLKSDLNFLSFNFKNTRGRLCNSNTDVIRRLLEHIRINHNATPANAKYDCVVIKNRAASKPGQSAWNMNVEDRVKAVKSKVDPIAEIISKQLNSINGDTVFRQKAYDIFVK